MRSFSKPLRCQGTSVFTLAASQAGKTRAPSRRAIIERLSSLFTVTELADRLRLVLRQRSQRAAGVGSVIPHHARVPEATHCVNRHEPVLLTGEAVRP